MGTFIRQAGEYLFGIARKELLQEGDPVNFQVRP
jgi:hypothetical protein